MIMTTIKAAIIIIIIITPSLLFLTFVFNPWDLYYRG